MARVPTALRAGLLALAGAACGGDSPSAPTPEEVIATASFADIIPGGVFRLEVDLIPPGKVATTVEWSGTTNVNIYVTTPSCVSGRDAISGACARVALTSGNAKPKVVSFQNPRVETYYYYLHNEGPGALTGTMETRLAR